MAMITPDPAAAQTDKIIEEIEKRITIEYAQAQREIKAKLDDYMRRFQTKDKTWQRWVSEGKRTQAEYDHWRVGQIAIGKRWEEMKETISQDLLNTSKIAKSIAMGYMPEVYALNHDYGTFQVEHDSMVDTSYSLYDRQTAERMFRDNPQMMHAPGKKVSQDIADGKAKLWNNQHVQSVMMQTLLQGDSLPDVTTRLMNAVGDTNRKAATRNARTMITGAQNAGRVDSYKRANDLGIETKKQWLATLDSRTRHAHRQLDGVSVSVDDPFINDFGKIRYPGDPTAAAANVYNCFVGDTKIVTDCNIIRSYKHEYSGELFTVKTSSGVKFTCTPNHPILTTNGWVPVERLNRGDNLLVASISDDSSLGINPYINHAFARIDAIHDFFDMSGGERTTSQMVNFHGDVPATDVEIITQKRFLGSNFDTCGRNSVNKFLLKYTDEAFMCKSTFVKHFFGIWFSALGIVGRAHKFLAILLGSVRHAVKHCFRTIARSNSSVFQTQSDNMSGNAEFSRKRFNGSTGIVFVDDIVDINVSSVCHIPVYNLQTDNEYYFVNSIIPENTGKRINNFAIAHNCRCTLIASIKGHEIDLSNPNLRHNKNLGKMTYEEWKDEKQSTSNPILLPEEKAENIRAKYIREYRGFGGPVESGLDRTLDIDSRFIQDAPKPVTTVINGKDISGTWSRRADEFAFEIEDIINAQGFDGKPRVVSRAEFDEAVKTSNGGNGFIAQRVYGAPGKDVAEAYRDELYNGKWYVDCSTGGSMYGKGMYTASDYSGELSNGIKKEMENYAMINKRRIIEEDDDYTRELNEWRNTLSRSERSMLNDYKTWGMVDPADKERVNQLIEEENEIVNKHYYSITETLTLDPSAKIITDSEINVLYRNQQKFDDVGSLATALGYDAINVEDAGSGGCSYTIILNRTKVIFLGE